MGPDEYHDGYPERSEPGLDNNAYTNVMAVWCLGRAFDTLEALPADTAQELQARLDITDDELDRWSDITRKMRVCFHGGVISQFEGYELLAELDWEAYRDAKATSRGSTGSSNRRETARTGTSSPSRPTW